MSSDNGCDPASMLRFYKQLYPFKSIFHWLNQDHAPGRLLTHREFSATLAGDIYLRYHSFNTVDEFKTNICRLNPTRFEIGAVYNARPKDKKTLRAGALQSQRREFVLDIDMTDYDNVRTCCVGKGICAHCWGFIAAAVRVLDNALRNQFGYRHLLWVYSGRRGIHCWVSDPEAMDLTDEQRRVLMGWLDVLKGSKDMARKLDVRKSSQNLLHPAIASASRLLNPKAGDPVCRWTFDQLILTDQDCFKTEEQWQKLLELLNHPEIGSTLRKEWTASPGRSSQQKWADILREVQKRKPGPARQQLLDALEDIILQYMYPRLDLEVSKRRNHLLKAPFCVHPGTGRVCVPVDPAQADNFDPEAVPTISQLLQELDELDAEGVARADWEKTSLKPYVDMLDRHANAVMQDALFRRKAANADSLAF